MTTAVLSSTEPGNTDQALHDLGVTDDDLTAEQAAALDRDGYLVLRGIVDDEWLQQLRDRLAELQASEARTVTFGEGGRGAELLFDLFNRGEVFERMLRCRPLLAAVRHVLGEFRVNSLNFRAAQPGTGAQQLHSDIGPVVDGTYRVCNSMWLIDDFTPDNGSTRVLPGTHTKTVDPADEIDDIYADHPDQIQLTGKAGDVVVFNAHLWHSGTLNRTEQQRRGMTLSFCGREEPQQLDQAEHIRKRVWDRLSPAERYLLDV